MTSDIVTRFAPSPTGYLHIGGARTALFNWLYARGRGGKFLLRIEDTDRTRHDEGAVEAILSGLSWLGLDWDGDPISQYDNRDRHAEIADKLLAEGHAYRCYMSAEALELARAKAREEKIRFESPWRDSDEIASKIDKPHVIRFKAPREGETIVGDAVQGDVKFPNSALDDLIILRSDGSPTYNLSVVVDDHDMKVTHVIRGDDHLVNAARQQQIYEALNWATPSFSHIPLIHGPDGAKLSKRHGDLGVEAYRDQGFLADALFNYLLRLGWAHGDDEIFSKNQALEWFDLDGVNKAPSRLDLEKLSSVNSAYIKQLTAEEFMKRARPFLTEDIGEPTNQQDTMLNRGANFLKERTSTLADVSKASEFIFLKRPLTIEGKVAKPLKKDGAASILKEAAAVLDDDKIWQSAERLEKALKDLAETKSVGFGQIGQPLRAALTAGRPSPSLGEVLYTLGREESLGRIMDCKDPN